MRLTNRLLHQKRIRFLGELLDSLFTAMPFLSLWSLASTTVILYEMTKGYILDLAPWLNIGYFVTFLIVLFVPVMLLVYKFVIPSVWYFRSTQMSHLEDKMDRTVQEMTELRKALNKLIEDSKEDKEQNAHRSRE